MTKKEYLKRRKTLDPDRDLSWSAYNRRTIDRATKKEIDDHYIDRLIRAWSR